jgi:hypothetical protein
MLQAGEVVLGKQAVKKLKVISMFTNTIRIEEMAYDNKNIIKHNKNKKVIIMVKMS